MSRSPKHKLSDSHSSLSSFASSTLQSGCHSRISSLSTVSEGHPFTSMLSDVPSIETKLAEHQQPNEGTTSNPQASATGAIAFRSRVTSGDDEGTKLSERPQSPSDAVLITRGNGSNRSSPTRDVRYVVCSLYSSHICVLYVSRIA